MPDTGKSVTANHVTPTSNTGIRCRKRTANPTKQIINASDNKKVAMDVDESARQWLAEHGYDKVMGARPMARIIQEKIKRALAEELLFGQLEHGGHVIVSTKDGEIHVEIEAKEPAAPAPVH